MSLYAAAVMHTRHFADTNTGLRRQRNEDAYLADDELGLFLLCDGVGGRARGEIAGAEAAKLIWEWRKAGRAPTPLQIALWVESPVRP